jgi:WhiB family redox-sensing transcriptional regulator
MKHLRLVDDEFDPWDWSLFGVDVMTEQWQDRALCAETDPEAFFPEKGGSTRDAKRICAGCEVKQECLDYALANDERFGIWGGLSERERRRLKRGITAV